MKEKYGNQMNKKVGNRMKYFNYFLKVYFNIKYSHKNQKLRSIMDFSNSILLAKLF